MTNLMMLAASGSEPLFILGPLAVAGVGIYIVKTIKDVKQTSEREQTKREVAAYVAEGSIRPEDAAMILNANGTASESSQAEQTIASGVAWGTISPAKAGDLLRTLRTPSSNPPGSQRGNPANS